MRSPRPDITLILSLLLVAGPTTAQELTHSQKKQAVEKLRLDGEVDWTSIAAGPLPARFLVELFSVSPASEFPRGITIQNAVVEQELNFERMSCPHFVQLNNCTFSGDVKLSDTVFSKSLSFSESRFLGRFDMKSARVDGTLDISTTYCREGVQLTGSSVGGHLLLGSAEIAGDANFDQVSVAENIIATEPSFCKSANFNRIKVGGSVEFGEKDRAAFHGETSFQYAEIGRYLQMYGHFEGSAHFAGVAATNANFSSSVFDGVADFVRLHATDDITANRCVFKHEVRFNSVRTLRAFIKNSHFEESAAEADFARMDISEQFLLDESKFKSNLNMDGLKVGGVLSFENVVFNKKTLRLADANVFELDLESTKDAKPLELGSIDLRFSDIQIGILRHLSVEQVDLTSTKFRSLSFDRVNWPKSAGAIHLDGWTFDRISAKSDADAIGGQGGLANKQESRDEAARILHLLKVASYSATGYSNLEAFYTKQGLSEEAGRIRLAKAEHERANMNWTRWLGSILLFLFVGNGAHPEWAIIWGLVIVAIGAFIFSGQKMERREKSKDVPADAAAPVAAPSAAVVSNIPPPDTSQKAGAPSTSTSPFIARVMSLIDGGQQGYNRIWYSLDLFVPAINMEANSIWRPKEEHWGLWLWLRLQRICGWIIVPIFVASIAGLIKS